MRNSHVIGKHLIIDFSGAIYQSDQTQIEFALRAASVHAGATVLNVNVHSFPANNGITGIALLAESHISVHSWPEHDYIAFDIFMCGDANPELALQWLTEFFKPEKITTRLIERAKPV